MHGCSLTRTAWSAALPAPTLPPQLSPVLFPNFLLWVPVRSPIQGLRAQLNSYSSLNRYICMRNNGN